MLRLHGLCLCLWLATAQVPMGPGSMQPYAGGGGRQRSYGYVREPAKGCFIAGSTLREMCYCAPFFDCHTRWHTIPKHTCRAWWDELVCTSALPDLGARVTAPLPLLSCMCAGPRLLLVARINVQCKALHVSASRWISARTEHGRITVAMRRQMGCRLQQLSAPPAETAWPPR